MMHPQSSPKHPFPFEENNPLPPQLLPQRHSINRINIILLPPEQELSEHPQLVAAKSLILLPPNYCYNCIIC